MSLVVVDADVLVRQRTGDETYVRNLLRELAPIVGGEELRLAAVTRHPELVPDGVEAVELEARAMARHLELPAIPSFPFPVCGRRTVRLAPVGLRAGQLTTRWPALRVGLEQPLVISA